jgi:serine protease Do
VTPVELGWELKDTPEGVMILQIQADGVAHDSKLEAGDIIETVDGRPVTTPGALFYELHRHAPGTSTAIGIMRNGQRRTERIRLPETHTAEVLSGTAATGVTGGISSAPIGQAPTLESLQAEIQALRAEIEALRQSQQQ